MLTNIENRLEELFEQIEMMPQDKVEAAEKVIYQGKRNLTTKCKVTCRYLCTDITLCTDL